MTVWYYIGCAICRAFDHVFETIQIAEGSKFLVHASFLEIYNEEVRDLLAKDTKVKLDLKEHPDKGVYIPGLQVKLGLNQIHHSRKYG